MNRSIGFLIAILVLGLVSCCDDPDIKDHLLVGNYIGSWDPHPEIIQKLSIEAYEDCSGLVFLFSLADSLDLNIISETEFTIDRYEINGFSNGVSGVIVEDTLYLQNETFNVSDKENTETLRTGTFVKQ
jgi:hypothetical protein